MNIFFILILSFFSLNCFFSSEISFDDSEQWRQELSENLFEAIKSYEAIVVPSPVSVDQPVGSEFALEQQIIEYPEIPCAFNSVQQALFAVILEAYPHIRNPEIYVVSTMQDFRYIAVVLKPRLGTLINFYRFEFDLTAISNDRVTLQDYADFDKFMGIL